MYYIIIIRKYENIPLIIFIVANEYYICIEMKKNINHTEHTYIY